MPSRHEELKAKETSARLRILFVPIRHAPALQEPLSVVLENGSQHQRPRIVVLMTGLEHLQLVKGDPGKSSRSNPPHLNSKDAWSWASHYLNKTQRSRWCMTWTAKKGKFKGNRSVANIYRSWFLNPNLYTGQIAVELDEILPPFCCCCKIYWKKLWLTYTAQIVLSLSDGRIIIKQSHWHHQTFPSSHVVCSEWLRQNVLLKVASSLETSYTEHFLVLSLESLCDGVWITTNEKEMNFLIGP